LGVDTIKGRADLLLFEIFPVDATEEDVRHDLLRVIGAAS
jgi:hypothetical protein